MVKTKDTPKKKVEKRPDLYFVFNLRGECLGDWANNALMLYKNTEDYEEVLSSAQNLGEKKDFPDVVMFQKVSREEFEKLFSGEDFVIDKAGEEDFQELERVADQIITIKTGQHRDYPKSYRDKYRE
jgi:hypothetical protein